MANLLHIALNRGKWSSSQLLLLQSKSKLHDSPDSSWWSISWPRMYWKERVYESHHLWPSNKHIPTSRTIKSTFGLHRCGNDLWMERGSSERIKRHIIRYRNSFNKFFFLAMSALKKALLTSYSKSWLVGAAWPFTRDKDVGKLHRDAIILLIGYIPRLNTRKKNCTNQKRSHCFSTSVVQNGMTVPGEIQSLVAPKCIQKVSRNARKSLKVQA